MNGDTNGNAENRFWTNFWWFTQTQILSVNTITCSHGIPSLHQTQTHMHTLRANIPSIIQNYDAPHSDKSSCSEIDRIIPPGALNLTKKQESIPVGCVPSAAVAVGGGSNGGVCPGGCVFQYALRQTPSWTEFLTHASLRTVINSFRVRQLIWMGRHIIKTHSNPNFCEEPNVSHREDKITYRLAFRQCEWRLMLTPDTQRFECLKNIRLNSPLYRHSNMNFACQEEKIALFMLFFSKNMPL